MVQHAGADHVLEALAEFGDALHRELAHLEVGRDVVDRFSKALGDLAPAFETRTLPEAVERAYELAASGDTVLLSPACSSFDMFTNFEERGEVFKKSVLELKRKMEQKWKTAGA